MRTLNQVTVLVVGLTVRDEHPETLHDFAFCYQLIAVWFWLVPNVF